MRGNQVNIYITSKVNVVLIASKFTFMPSLEIKLKFLDLFVLDFILYGALSSSCTKG